jgi:hypothetical protein
MHLASCHMVVTLRLQDPKLPPHMLHHACIRTAPRSLFRGTLRFLSLYRMRGNTLPPNTGLLYIQKRRCCASQLCLGPVVHDSALTYRAGFPPYACTQKTSTLAEGTRQTRKQMRTMHQTISARRQWKRGRVNLRVVSGKPFVVHAPTSHAECNPKHAM